MYGYVPLRDCHFVIETLIVNVTFLYNFPEMIGLFITSNNNVTR